MKQFTTPILFIIFNRPETEKKVFDVIRKIKPKNLYVAADGPRENIIGEKNNCLNARRIIDEGIDWDCKIHKLYRNNNLGCKVAVSSAVDWFFKNVDEGIILEDDCLPDPSFFEYCSVLLEKYRDNSRIMMVSGDNFHNGITMGDGSYYFSKYAYIWGWATWKRAWKYYDVKLNPLIVQKIIKKSNNFFNNKEKKYWLNLFDKVANNRINTWDYQWVYTIIKKNALSIVPNINLISNIGFGVQSTHTKTGNLSNLGRNKITKLIHPVLVEENIAADLYVYKNYFNPMPLKKYLNKVISLFNKKHE